MFRGNRYSSIHSDHLGTPRLMKDDTAKPVWQWAYSAFGDNKPTGILKATTNPNSAITNQPVLLNATNPGAVLNLRFPGQYWDSESNLHFNYLRSYQPLTDRYTQPDPTGLDGGLNRSIYAEGNALSLIDPTGQNARQMMMFCAKDPKACANAATAAVGVGIAAATGAVSSAADAIKEFCKTDNDDPCKQLNDDVQKAKDKVGQLGKCVAGMAKHDLLQRHAAWLNLAISRAKRDEKCWAGGDAGHQNAQADAWANVGRCTALLK
jgi:RHS repeat-associated protein